MPSSSLFFTKTGRDNENDSLDYDTVDYVDAMTQNTFTGFRCHLDIGVGDAYFLCIAQHYVL